MESMAELGREAVAAIKTVAKLKWEPDHYVNKTAKYVSIKIVTDHLTAKQLEQVTNRLKRNPRFLQVRNGTSKCSACRMAGEQFFSIEWEEPKVVVRFSRPS